MSDKKYGIYEVLIGVFDNFPVKIRRYNYNKGKFNKFFYGNMDKYSVLNEIPLDNKELVEIHGKLLRLHFFDLYNTNPRVEHLNKDLFTICFLEYKKKFNETELKELGQLSLDFQKEFCLNK
jgi:hypothetical protein